MRNYIEIKIEFDEGDTVKLVGRFQSNGYAGQGSAYFSIKQLMAEIEKFGQYPISKDVLPCIRGGFLDAADQLKFLQEYVHISLRPIGPKGDLRLTVRVAEPDYELDDLVRYSASAEFKTNYEQMTQFVKDMTAMFQGKISQVLLEEFE